MRRFKAVLITISESDPRPPSYVAKLFHKPRYDELAKIVHELIGEADILLDIGCGKGVLYDWFVKSRFNVGMYVGCDIDLRYLKEAKVEKVLCDAHRLPFRERSANCVICSEVLEHLKRPLLAFHSILKISSQWVIVTFPNEKVKNALGFRYPEHISDINFEELISLSRALGYSLIYYKKLYFAFPPSIFDKIMKFSKTSAKLAAVTIQVLSKVLRELCLIKTVILVLLRE